MTDEHDDTDRNGSDERDKTNREASTDQTDREDSTEDTDRKDSTDDADPGPDLNLDLGSLYWDTHRWKTYAPYREDDDLVYMVTVRRKSEVADALSAGSLVAHEDRLADSQFERLDAVDSFRTRAADEARTLADLLTVRTDDE